MWVMVSLRGEDKGEGEVGKLNNLRFTIFGLRFKKYIFDLRFSIYGFRFVFKFEDSRF